MTPYHHDDWMTVWQGDCREVMRQMEPESVHCVVTSPPYWGLRDYGTASWVGGDEGCDHVSGMARGDTDRETPGGRGGSFRGGEVHFRDICGKCGATRVDSQLGLEATPEEFVANMVDVFREVKRVLRSDGTCWVNLGDSYVAGQGGRQSAIGEMPAAPLRSDANPRQRDDVDTGSWAERDATVKMTPARGTTFLKPKDLVGIPWRVAFALQADGWYLRSDIIWAKPNPMPESVTDRPTKSHEYLFLLTKSARYYYDAYAVREANSNPDLTDVPHDWHDRPGNGEWPSGTGGRMGSVTSGRNLRTVWTIATAPYPGAHFATFPPKLVEPCIKAGAPEKVCGECGAGWRRVTEERPYPKELANAAKAHGGVGNNLGGQRHQDWLDANPRRSLGFIPSCKHDAETVPAVVLDPFAGSGTVGMVAQSLSRRAVLIDLNGDYLVQAMSRNQQSPLGLETA